MFKRKKKSTEDKSFSVQDLQDDGAVAGSEGGQGEKEEVEKDTERPKKKVMVGMNQFSSKDAKKSETAEDRSNAFKSSRSQEAAKYGGDAFATNDIHTETDKDGIAILERLAKETSNKELAEGSNIYKGLEAYKSVGQKLSMEDIRKNQQSGTLGPLRAPTNVRVTTRFDYQPDVCKDFKETGYCGYGDNCIYLHDRSNYKTGWQLEKEWETEQKAKKQALATGTHHQDQRDASSAKKKPKDLPFACHICRKPFVKPVVTICEHMFCESCAFKHYSKSTKCAVCGEQTKGIFNAPRVLPPKPPASE